MRTRLDLRGDHGRLELEGRFDITTRTAFYSAHRELQATGLPRRLTVDLAQVHYIDSSALGMLLVLRDHALRHGTAVALSGCRPEVLRALQLVNFQRLFRIER